MKTNVGKEAVNLTWQDNFPVKTECKCGGEARLAFAAQEKNEQEYVCGLHKNIPKEGFWPHDAIAVAVYFCKKCFSPITLWNQA